MAAPGAGCRLLLWVALLLGGSAPFCAAIDTGCDRHTLSSGGLSLVFPPSNRTGLRTIQCSSVNRNFEGSVTMSCLEDSKFWSSQEGSCVRKGCAGREVSTLPQGIKVQLPDATAGQGEITVACGASHTGSISVRCDRGASEYTTPVGTCLLGRVPTRFAQMGVIHAEEPTDITISGGANLGDKDRSAAKLSAPAPATYPPPTIPRPTRAHMHSAA